MKEKKEQRIALMMEPTLVEQIDTYRFARRISSRAEAMRQMIEEFLRSEATKATTE